MEISRATLNKIAHLARLGFGEAEAERMMGDLSEIVSWTKKLQEVDTRGVEPLISMSQEVNVLREDVAHQSLTREEALARSPQQDGEFYVVPNVIE